MPNEQIKIPDMGGADEAEIIEVLVAVGDQVELEQSLLVLESDKASMEVPSPLAGTITKLLVANGDMVETGKAVAEVEVSGAAVEESPEPESKPEPESTPEAEQSENSADSPTQKEEAAASEPTTASATKAIELPDIGDDAAEVIEISIAVGDVLNVDDTLVVLESDKASMEVPCPEAGTVLAIHVKEGDELKTGALLIDLQVSGSASLAAAPTSTESPAADDVKSTEQSAETRRGPAPKAEVAQSPAELATSNDGSVYAGPAVRKLAREFGVELARVSGSGPKGRILKEDLQNFVKTGLNSPAAGRATAGTGIPAIPEIDFSAFGPVDIQPMSRLHKLTAANMSRSWLNVPHVTQYDDADITDLEDFRQSLKPEMQRRDIKLSPLPFLVKACAVALMKHPKFRSSLHADGENVVFKDYCHIGMAVDTEAGLVVPVIRDADKKSVWDIGEEILDLAGRAKDRKLKVEEMQGGCFTVSSLGGIGGLGFTPIVNAPEVGILGVSRMTVKPVFDGSDFQPRKMLPLSLSYDHRAINGGDAGRFLTELCQLLSDIRLQLM